MFKKKILTRVLSLIVFIFILSINVKGQFNLSIGVEGVVTQGGFKRIASYGFGGTFGAEIGVSDKSGVTIQAGFIYLIPEESYAATHMLPFQAGLKMYFNSKDNGAYFHPHVGAHIVSETTKGYSGFGYTIPEKNNKFTGVSYGLGIGFISNKKLDVEVKYILVSKNDGTINYLGLRASYILF